MQDVLVEGVTFAALAGALVERGQIADAIGREQEWLDNRLKQRRVGFEGEIEFEIYDGRWLLAREEPAPNGGRIGIWREITARKHAEQALKESEQRFREIMESFADWYWETGPDHRFTRVGGAIEQHIKIHPDFFIGVGRWEIEGNEEPSDAEFWRQHLATLDAQLTFRDVRFKRTRGDGELRVYSIDGRPRYSDAGDFVGYRGVGRDVTELSRLEAAVAQK